MPNHTNNDREFNLTIDNDGGSIYARSNMLVTIANRNNGNGSGTMYMYQSVVIWNNYAINNLMVDKCYAANYGGDFHIKSKPGFSITINNLITANSEAGNGCEIVSGGGSGSGTEKTQNENGALVIDGIEIQEK